MTRLMSGIFASLAVAAGVYGVNRFLLFLFYYIDLFFHSGIFKYD